MGPNTSPNAMKIANIDPLCDITQNWPLLYTWGYHNWTHFHQNLVKNIIMLNPRIVKTVVPSSQNIHDNDVGIYTNFVPVIS